VSSYECPASSSWPLNLGLNLIGVFRVGLKHRRSGRTHEILEIMPELINEAVCNGDGPRRVLENQPIFGNPEKFLWTLH
jgi:hypothetical protein